MQRRNGFTGSVLLALPRETRMARAGCAAGWPLLYQIHAAGVHFGPMPHQLYDPKTTTHSSGGEDFKWVSIAGGIILLFIASAALLVFSLL
jgi:hypothetical protein